MRAAPLTALLLSVLLLAGCGGGGEGEGTTGSASTATSPRSTPSSQSQGQAEAKAGDGSEEGSEAQSPSRAHQRQIKNPPIASSRTPGQKAVAPGVPIVKGGDNSIQVFGTEGEEGEAAQATRNLSAYLAAVVAGRWDEACAGASAEFRQQLTQLMEQARAKEGAQKPEGCAAILEVLLGGAKGAAAFAAQAPRKVLSFRVEAPYAYLIYEDTKGTIRAIAMADEDGEWKVNVPQPSELQTTTGGTDESQQ